MRSVHGRRESVKRPLTGTGESKMRNNIQFTCILICAASFDLAWLLTPHDVLTAGDAVILFGIALSMGCYVAIGSLLMIMMNKLRKEHHDDKMSHVSGRAFPATGLRGATMKCNGKGVSRGMTRAGLRRPNRRNKWDTETRGPTCTVNYLKRGNADGELL